MNPLNINHIKFDKANSINLRYKKLQKITNYFRAFEIFLVLAVISRVSFQLPLAIFKFFDEYFRNIFFIPISPKFVFIVGNVIVVTLFVNSNMNSRPRPRKLAQHGHKKVKFDQKKYTSMDENTMIATIFSTPEHQVVRIYHRSQSEKLVRKEKVQKSCCSLRRSNTDFKRLRGSNPHVCCKDAGKGHFPEDHMSNDEFKKTVEDFIAKQQRFLREEDEEVEYFSPL